MNDMPGRLPLSSRLYLLRTAHHLTQKQVAEALHVCRQTYSNYERGLRQPSLDILVSLAGLYRISLDDLAGKDVMRTQKTG